MFCAPSQEGLRQSYSGLSIDAHKQLSLHHLIACDDKKSCSAVKPAAQYTGHTLTATSGCLL